MVVLRFSLGFLNYSALELDNCFKSGPVVIWPYIVDCTVMKSLHLNTVLGHTLHSDLHQNM